MRLSKLDRHGVRAAFVAGALAMTGLAAGPAMAAGEAAKPDRLDWSFAGVFGTYDQAQLQRGFKIYQQVCQSCHSMELVAFRNLTDPRGPGFSEAEAIAIAEQYTVTDGPNDDGEMFERPAKLTDRFPPPYANDAMAKAANGGAYPPDFSLLAKARAATAGFPTFVFDAFTAYAEAGPDYIHALLTGYQDPPPDEEVVTGKYYNPYFLAGPWIGMPPILSDGIVEYTDGTPETLEQYSKDVAAFMMWAAEPHLPERKELGFRVMIFLAVFLVLIYLSKRKLWQRIKH